MRSVQDARNRWKYLFTSYQSLESLKEATVNVKGNEDTIGGQCLRSVCWKLFLVLPDYNHQTWSPILGENRNKYSNLKGNLVNLSSENTTPYRDTDVDPLADDDKSPWKTLRQDEELRREIQQDLDRTYPDNEYFRSQRVQNSLLNILFIWCKLNHAVSYRQGMHELLAPIFWTVDQDAIEPKHSTSSGSSSWDDQQSVSIGSDLTADDEMTMLNMLDTTYVEHDTYMLFTKVMESAHQWYQLGEDGTKKTAATTSNSPIVELSRQIHDDLLQKVDPQLANHLHDTDVLPQVFLIRWVRLMFGREFSFEECLVLWDGIFAQDSQLHIVKLICVAMLLRIRWQLMEADYSTALTLLLRYPSPTPTYSPLTFLLDAKYLQNNLTTEGGSYIIKKYSDREPGKLSSTPSLRPSTPPARRSGSRQRALSPLSPRTLTGVGNLNFEGLVQNIFDRGEKWGVNKAFKDAVSEVKRVSQSVGEQQRELVKRWTEGEERRQLLGDMLQISLDALHQSLKMAQLDEEQKSVRSKALQRIAYVKDCLVDGRTDIDHKWLDDDTSLSPKRARKPSTSRTQPPPVAKTRQRSASPVKPSNLQNPISTEQVTKSSDSVTASPVTSPVRRGVAKPPSFPSYNLSNTDTLNNSPTIDQSRSPTTSPSIANAFSTGFTEFTIDGAQKLDALDTITTTAKNRLGSPLLAPKTEPVQQKQVAPRKSLAQSPFAWMLGDDPVEKHKADFVTSERRGSEGGSLFGGSGGGTFSRKKSVVPDREEEEDGFDFRSLGRASLHR